MPNNSPADEAALVAAHELEQVCIKHDLILLAFIGNANQTLVVNHNMKKAQNREIIRENFKRSMAIIERAHP